MNYLQKNSRRDSGVLRPIKGTIIILAISGLFYFFAPNFFNQVIFGIARPVWRLQDYVSKGFSNFFLIFADNQRLKDENASLQSERGETSLALLDLDALKKENEELKKLLGRVDSEKRLLAVLLAKPNRSPYDTLVLDIGSDQGVRVGDLVVSGDFTIGTVKEVFASQSKAVLASTPGETFTVRIGDSGVDADAVGRGGGNFIAKLPKGVLVNKGDLIKFPQLKQRFLGVVEDIELTDADSFQLILFKLPVNMNTLEWVEVIKSLK